MMRASRPERSPDVHLLGCSDLTVRFGGTVAVDQVSLELERGEVLGVVGPNGAGKSTLVNLLSGHQAPSSGTVYLGGRDADPVPITRTQPHHRWKMGVSRSFQGMRLYERLTVFENILAGALGRRKDLDSAVLSNTAGELIEEFNLSTVAHRNPSELSIGQSKLVGVARALISQPFFILLDEPLAGLDRDEVADFLPVIRQMAIRQNAGILFIDHDLEAVSSLCDRIIVMHQGRVLAEGTADVFEQPEVQAAYMGTHSAESFGKHWRSAESSEHPDSIHHD